ncbi:MAG: hypothetical protein FWE88_03975 [Phycisphaerae bacterium]|nr:hypothetical protein [Phycisphaerae bacterium]
MKAVARWFGVFVLAAVCVAAVSAAGQASPATEPAEAPAGAMDVALADAVLPAVSDVALERAKAYVDNSDRYLHHSHLKRGMKGYGKTVLAGVTIERFEVEIVSVVSHWGPHQDVILAKLSGLELEKTNVIAGMSGSPVYVVDPRDGKEKMVGAVAYGWFGQKEPLCGLQPITQMLAMNGVVGERRAMPTSAPAAGESPREPVAAARAVHRENDKVASKAFLEMAFAVRNAEIARAFRGAGDAEAAVAKAAAGEAPALLPLRTPLMVSGVGREALANASAGLAAFGMVPVQAGAVAGVEAEAADAKLEPGSGIAIPLVHGDASISAVGTVTDVIDGKVLAFGHSFFSDGDVRFPMGPAYIHSVVAGVFSSFKLGSLAHISGALTRDENVGVAGDLGENVEMIPMTVEVVWKDLGETQQYNYDMVGHRMFTPRLVGMLVEASITGWKNLPESHTLRYTAAIDFGELGVYSVDNVSSGMDTMDIYGEMIRPLLVAYRNPWQSPPEPRSVTVRVTVEEKSLAADVVEFKLDGKVYRPGETLTGTLTVEPYRQRRTTLPVTFALPRDLPEGTYTLDVCDAYYAAQALRREMPQRYDPRNVSEMLQAVQTMASNRRDCLYLRLPLNEGGMAIRQKELPDLPGSKAAILAQADREDVKAFRKTLVRPLPGPYVFNGAASATFEVSKTAGDFSQKQVKE